MIIVHYRRCWKYTVYIVLFHRMQNEYDIFEKNNTDSAHFAIRSYMRICISVLSDSHT